jgi:hypothetical protein
MRNNIPLKSNYIKLTILLIILNSTISLILYTISPNQIPSRIISGEFLEYKDKNSVFIPVLFQLILLPVSYLLFKMVPAWAETKLKFYPNLIRKSSKIFMGKDYIGINNKKFMLAFYKAFILVLSLFIVIFNLLTFGFIVEDQYIEIYTYGFVILFIILLIPIFRFFSKYVT